jgi:hypothetical protein
VVPLDQVSVADGAEQGPEEEAVPDVVALEDVVDVSENVEQQIGVS